MSEKISLDSSELINTIKVANISIKKTINNLFLLITASLNHQ